MISGIGTDIVSIARIESAWRARPQAFMQRILGPDEQTQFELRRQQSEQRALRYLATRFAAKEAFAKALGTGMRDPVGWQSLQILNDALGRPQLAFSGALADLMQQRRLAAQVSLSDEQQFAVAFVLLEQQQCSGGRHD